MRYNVVYPRSFFCGTERHGIWDVALDERGCVKSFDSIEEAKEYGEHTKDKYIGEFYVMKLVG